MYNYKILIYLKSPGCVVVFGVLYLVLIIIGFIVLIISAGLIIPSALAFSTISLYGSNNSLSIATIIISAVKLIINSTFWI